MQKINEESLRPLAYAEQSLQSLICSLKAKNFYHATRIAVEGTTAHDMERKLNPASIKKTSTGQQSSAKKWRGYRDGLNVPGKTTVARAERVAGCALENEVSMALWDALDLHQPLDVLGLLKRLSPSVRRQAQNAIAALDEVIASPQKDVFTYSNYYCSWIDRLVPLSLSSITVTTILYRYVISKGCTEFIELVELIEDELVNQLILLCIELQQRGIFQQLVCIFWEHVFALNLVSKRSQSPIELTKSAMFLNLLAYADPALLEIKQVDFKSRQYAMEGFYLGDFGSWPPLALYCTREIRGEQTEGKDISPRNDFETRQYEAWESIVSVMADAQRPPAVSHGHLSKNLKLDAFALIKSETEAALQRAEQHASPLANWWSKEPPRAELCTFGLRQLLKREWPRNLEKSI